MSSSELESLFERMIATLKDERAKRELEELRDRKFTLTDLMDALENASDEELQRWERDIFSVTELEEFPAPEPPTGDPPPSPAPPGSGEPPAGNGEPPAPPAEPQTRPGRKRGNVYDWDIDEQGNIVQLGIGRVYNGEDEPDEVEIPLDSEPQGDE